jgi:hypothetical protein
VNDAPVFTSNARAVEPSNRPSPLNELTLDALVLRAVAESRSYSHTSVRPPGLISSCTV